jgi:hypothetical protein
MGLSLCVIGQIISILKKVKVDVGTIPKSTKRFKSYGSIQGIGKVNERIKFTYRTC